ncbi:MAG: glycine/sarcosine/betaine reductase selenoprotein B family protein [Thermoanaerobaculia bacterium]
MGDMSEFSLPVRAFIKTYRWRRIDPVPWAPLEKPLSESRVGLVSTAGLTLIGQKPCSKEVKGGDPCYREIPWDTEVSQLVENHRSGSWDHTGVEQDMNVAFPLDRMRELLEQGRVGSLAERYLSFMGSVTSPGRMVRDIIPLACDNLLRQEVEAALLVPV